MDLRTAILKEHSKDQANSIAAWVDDDAERLAELMNLFLHDEYRVVQRAAWPVSLVGEKYPQLIMPHLKAMIGRARQSGVHVSVRRNVVRVLQHMEIPEELHADVMNMCFDFLSDVKETIAVRCFSMTVLGNLAWQYPDITVELRSILEGTLMQGASAGFKSRAAKTLNALTKK